MSIASRKIPLLHCKLLAICPFTCYTIFKTYDGVAQWIERSPPERKVAGSTPATVTTSHSPLPRLFPFPGCSSPFSGANKPVPQERFPQETSLCEW